MEITYSFYAYVLVATAEVLKFDKKMYFGLHSIVLISSLFVLIEKMTCLFLCQLWQKTKNADVRSLMPLPQPFSVKL